MRSIILIALLLAVSHIVGAIQMSGDYIGEGDFDIRSHLGGDLVEARGIGDIAYGQQFTWNRTYAGFDFDGQKGFFSAEGLLGVGLTHSIRLFDAENISARATIGGSPSAATGGNYSRDYTWYNLTLNGSFQEDVYDSGEFGQPDALLQARMKGVIYEINSSVKDVRVNELNIMDWVKR